MEMLQQVLKSTQNISSYFLPYIDCDCNIKNLHFVFVKVGMKQDNIFYECFGPEA